MIGILGFEDCPHRIDMLPSHTRIRTRKQSIQIDSTHATLSVRGPWMNDIVRRANIHKMLPHDIREHFEVQVKDPDALTLGPCRKSRCAPRGTAPEPPKPSN